MEHDGEARELNHDGIEHIERERRGKETSSLRVAGALLGLKLVSAVAGTDRDCERVNASLRGEVDNLLRLSVVANIRLNLVLNASEHAKLTLNGDIILVRIVNDLLGEGDILIIRERRAIDHDRREAHVYTILAELKAVAMVEVKNDLRMIAAKLLSIGNSALSEVAEEGCIGIVARTLRNLKDNGRLELRRSCNDSLKLLKIVEVESRNSPTTVDSPLEHLTGVHETKILEID